MRLGDQGEVHLHLPALVDLSSAAVTTRGPGAVGDSNEIGARRTNLVPGDLVTVKCNVVCRNYIVLLPPAIIFVMDV